MHLSPLPTFTSGVSYLRCVTILPKPYYLPLLPGSNSSTVLPFVCFQPATDISPSELPIPATSLFYVPAAIPSVSTLSNKETTVTHDARRPARRDDVHFGEFGAQGEVHAAAVGPADQCHPGAGLDSAHLVVSRWEPLTTGMARPDRCIEADVLATAQKLFNGRPWRKIQFVQWGTPVHPANQHTTSHPPECRRCEALGIPC